MAAVLERQTVTVLPTGGALGADVRGRELALAATETVDAIKRAVVRSFVPRFRGQRLDDDQLLRFAPILASSTGRRSSPPHVSRSAERNRYMEPAEEGRSYISLISNIVENARRSALSAPTSRSGTRTCRTVRSRPRRAPSKRSKWRRHRLRQHVPQLRHPVRGVAAAGRRSGLPPRFEPQQRGGAAPRVHRGDRPAVGGRRQAPTTRSSARIRSRPQGALSRAPA